jgi:L-aminopeptidase/D-esterase-like protein
VRSPSRHRQASRVARLRACNVGIPFDGNPCSLNAITDVRGIEVGHTTLIRGDGKLVVGRGPVRTGVTVILPRGIATTAQSSQQYSPKTATAR